MPRTAPMPSLAGPFDTIRAEYDAARESKFRRRRFGVTSTPRSADYHTRNDGQYFKMIEIARDMDRNDPMLGQAITRAVDNTIQAGPTLDPDTGDKGLDQEIRDKFFEWSDDPDLCDLSGEMTLHEMGRLALRQMIVDGDIFALPNIYGTVQMIEGHRCQTPRNTRRNVINGVLLNENRVRLEYWFAADTIDGLMGVQKVSDITPVRARDENGFRQVLHVYDPRRVSQTRGVSGLAPIVDMQSILGDTVFATLVKVQVSACWAVLRERGVTYGGQGERIVAGEQSTETLPNGQTRLIEQLGPGMDIPGAIGEKLSAFTPNVVANEALQFIDMLLGWVGCNIGMPPMMFNLDSRATNFSGWRGSFEQAKMGFMANQDVLGRKFYKPIYLWKLRDWMSVGDEFSRRLLSKGQRVYQHCWGMPRWPYIEPVKDAAADLLQIRNGLNSPRRVQQERGRDLSDIQRETVEDNANAMVLAIEQAKAIEKQTGEKVNWRELLCLPAPDGVTVTLTPDAPAQDTQTSAKPKGSAKQ